MAFMNTSDFIGVLVVNLTNNVTGSIYLSLMAVMLLILIFFMAMNIPLELTAILIIPLIIAFAAYFGGDWRPFAGIVIAYLGFITAKLFFF